jgi:transposase
VGNHPCGSGNIVFSADGVGLWLAARRLDQGKFVWAPAGSPNVALEHAQLNALVLGLP